MKTTAKIFMHGRSQAVRLPKEFRFPGNEVEIAKVGDVVTLKPVASKTSLDWSRFWADYDALGLTDDHLINRNEGYTAPRTVSFED